MDAKLRRLARVGHSRKEIAEDLGLTVQQVGNRLSYTKTRIAPKPPAPSANPLVDAIRRLVAIKFVHVPVWKED